MWYKTGSRQVVANVEGDSAPKPKWKITHEIRAGGKNNFSVWQDWPKGGSREHVVGVHDPEKGICVGAVKFAEKSGRRLYPLGVMVEPHARRQGAATAMYEHMLSKGYKIERSKDQSDKGRAFRQAFDAKHPTVNRDRSTLNAGTAAGVKKEWEIRHRQAGAVEHPDPSDWWKDLIHIEPRKADESELMQAGITHNPKENELRSLWREEKKKMRGYGWGGHVIRGIVNDSTGDHYWAPADRLHYQIQKVVDPKSMGGKGPVYHHVFYGTNGKLQHSYEGGSAPQVDRFLQQKAGLPPTVNGPIQDGAILKNPTEEDLQQGLKEAKRNPYNYGSNALLRGIVHRQTGDHYWADAASMVHHEIMKHVDPTEDSKRNREWHCVYMGRHGAVRPAVGEDRDTISKLQKLGVPTKVRYSNVANSRYRRPTFHVLRSL